MLRHLEIVLCVVLLAICALGALLFVGPKVLVFAVVFPVVGIAGVLGVAFLWERLRRLP